MLRGDIKWCCMLFEAGSQLGGQVRLAQRATWRRDLGNVAD